MAWLSRRGFLGAAASAVGGVMLGSRAFAEDDSRLTILPGMPQSRVVEVQSRHVINGLQVHRDLLAEMLDHAITELTGADTPAQGWKAILKPSDIIGIKFNQSGQAVLATTPAFANAIISSLVDAGWRPEQIVCIEVLSDTGLIRSTAPVAEGFDRKPTDFGSGTDELASVLRQVTAIIDVPFLKTHNIAGMTCSLKNLSHGLIKHPARYHAHGCSPYIADIVWLEEIRAKLRLCLVDALRVVYRGGPSVTDTGISEEGMIIASRDPVATDSVALRFLNKVRLQNNLSRIVSSPEDLAYLAAAHRRGLGIALPHGIDLFRVQAS
ncbi:MAG: DUF362 domain-containing protein [Phycisphaerales bacterium]|nr:MAG: DUF362 domain-containing protein [Phycisphaerales bacterium]